MHHFDNVMLSIDRFVSESITSRSGSMFAVDIEANKEQLKQEIESFGDRRSWFYRFFLYPGGPSL